MYDDFRLKCIYQSFFWSKDGNFCPDILLFFKEKMSGRFTKMSGHEFDQNVILNTFTITFFNIFFKSYRWRQGIEREFRNLFLESK